MTKHLELLNKVQISKITSANAFSQRFAVLEKWIEDLIKVVGNPLNNNISLLAGRAVMIECADASACQELIPEIAHVSGLQYLKLTSDEVFTWLVNEQNNGVFIRGETLTAPTLAYVPIECFIKADEKSNKNQYGWDVPTLQSLSKALDVANFNSPLVIVVIGEQYLDLSEELRAAHGFDRRFTIAKTSPLERFEEFMAQVGPDACDDSVVGYPEKVGLLLNHAFPDKRRLSLLMMSVKRLVAGESRLITYKDLVTFSARGTGDIALWPHLNEKNLYRTAVHEAGHALVAVLDSGGGNIPDYVSISPGKGFLGVTVESYGYLYRELGCDAYQNSRHSVRVALGGRAAEELVLGADQIGTSGLRSDLEEVSGNVRGFFAVHGICVDMEEAQHTGVNLAAVVNGESASEAAHIESLMRVYIERQYRNTLEQMRANRTLLDAIIELLMKKRSIYQDDLITVLNNYHGGLINALK